MPVSLPYIMFSDTKLCPYNLLNKTWGGQVLAWASIGAQPTLQNWTRLCIDLRSKIEPWLFVVSGLFMNPDVRRAAVQWAVSSKSKHSFALLYLYIYICVYIHV